MNSEGAGKVVLVTGSSKGLGLAIAEKFAQQGCQVAINARHAAELLAVAQQSDAFHPFAGDVSNPKVAQTLVADITSRLGRLDALVCNVGSGQSVPPGEEYFDEWNRVFSQNLWSTTNCVEAARHALKKTQGAIICISSICGLETVPGAPATYTAAKAALNAYVRAIARPLGRDGVRINAVAPGNLLFDGSVWQKKMKEDKAAVDAFLQEQVSLARLGDPKEIAELVYVLAFSSASFVTGSVWKADGGQARSS